MFVVDTDILVYASDPDAELHRTCRERLADWGTRLTVVRFVVDLLSVPAHLHAPAGLFESHGQLLPVGSFSRWF